jgi:AraC-like DNA-binding protein
VIIIKLFCEELFNDLPAEIPRIVKTYSSDRITVLKANNVFSEPKGFKCYKFLIPSKNMPQIVVQQKKHLLERNKIFPLNPDQVHLYTEEKLVETYIPVFIQTKYMREYSHLLTGKDKLLFHNESYKDVNSNISSLVFLFMEEAKSRQIGYEFVLQSLNTQIIISLLRNTRNSLPYDWNKEYSDAKTIKHVREYLHSYLCSEFSLDELAAFANYSPYHLIRIFKKHTGKTPYKYLMGLKIERAKSLLEKNACSISEVSILCGFNNRTHFSTVFKRMVGMPPSEYRKLTKN